MLRKNGMYFLLTLKFVHAKINLVHGALAQLESGLVKCTTEK